MKPSANNLNFFQRHANAIVMACVVIGLMVQPLIFPPPPQPCTMCTIEKMSRLQQQGDCSETKILDSQHAVEVGEQVGRFSD